MYCNNCGTQLPENSVFCSQCGKKQDIQITPEVRQEEETAVIDETMWDVANVLPSDSAPDAIPPIASEQKSADTVSEPAREKAPVFVQTTSNANIPQAPVPHPAEFVREIKPAEPPTLPEIKPPLPVQPQYPPLSVQLPKPKQKKQKVQKEKTFFGMAAFVFCVSVILVLALALGIVSGLYYSSCARELNGGRSAQVTVSDELIL